MVRLVFRPYTQIRRTICTSVSLRTSISVSTDFVLTRHRSPSFGSQQTCSNSHQPQVVERSIVPRRLKRFLPQRHKSSFTFITHLGLTPKYSHVCQTPWSVFQDGSFKTISSLSLICRILSKFQFRYYNLQVVCSRVSKSNIYLTDRDILNLNQSMNEGNPEGLKPASFYSNSN